MDTENADVMKKMKINGFDALIICKGERVHIEWLDTERIVICSLITNGVDQESAIKIAENVAVE